MINEWNKISTDCVNASNMNMLKNKVDKYLKRVGYTDYNGRTLDGPMTFLFSTCYLELFVLDGNLNFADAEKPTNKISGSETARPQEKRKKTAIKIGRLHRGM